MTPRPTLLSTLRRSTRLMALVALLFLAKSAMACGCWTDSVLDAESRSTAVAAQDVLSASFSPDEELPDAAVSDGCKHFCSQQFTTPPPSVSIARSSELPDLRVVPIPGPVPAGVSTSPFRPPIT